MTRYGDGRETMRPSARAQLRRRSSSCSSSSSSASDSTCTSRGSSNASSRISVTRETREAARCQRAGKTGRMLMDNKSYSYSYPPEPNDGRQSGIDVRASTHTSICECKKAVIQHRQRYNSVEATATQELARLIKEVHGWTSTQKRIEYLLVSAPEHNVTHDLEVLNHASYVIKLLGFDNVAGDAKDRFHTEVMDATRMTSTLKVWRDAWKGKVCAALQQVQRFRPGVPIHVIAIEGGPECQWECQELVDKMLPQFQDVQLQRCRDFEAFLDFFMTA